MRKWWPLLARQSDESMAKRLEALRAEAVTLLSLLNSQQVVATKREQLYDVLAGIHKDSQTPTLPPHLTPILSHLLLEHLQLFDYSRSADPARRRSVRSRPGVLPGWWDLSTDDRMLVLAVRACGWRADMWDVEDVWKAHKTGLSEWFKQVGTLKAMTSLVARWMECACRSGSWARGAEQQRAQAAGYQHRQLSHQRQQQQQQHQQRWRAGAEAKQG